LAERVSEKLGLRISDYSVRKIISKKYIYKDVFYTEDLIKDYISAFMPELCLNDIKKSQNIIGKVCSEYNIFHRICPDSLA